MIQINKFNILHILKHHTDIQHTQKFALKTTAGKLGTGAHTWLSDHLPQQHSGQITLNLILIMVLKNKNGNAKRTPGHRHRRSD